MAETTKRKVWEKILEVQSKLKAPKSQRNNFGNYNYRNCEDILESVKPILKEVNATVILTDELLLIGERYYIKATARFIDVETGAEESNSAYAREEEVKKGMDGSQITGSASSYARKYALNGLFAIDDTKDSDTTNNETNRCTKEQVAKMRELQVIEANILRKFKITKLEDLTYNQAENIIKIKEKSMEIKQNTENEAGGE